MTDETDAAPAAAEHTPIQETDTGPARSDRIEATPRDAIDRAFETIGASEGRSGAEVESPSNSDGTLSEKPAKDGAGTPGEGGDDGTRAAEPASLNPNEAPNRFSPDAREAWKEAPLPVRAEVRRMEREFEAGIDKYRGDAEAFGEYKQFADILEQTGQTFDEVLNHYIGIENQLAEDPLGGLDLICRNLGTSLPEVAAQVMHQSPDASASEQDPMIDGLRSQIADLQTQLGGLTTTFMDEKSGQATHQIEEFSANNPRFDELSSDIAFFLTTNRASGLQEAYDLAARLNPASVAKPEAAIAINSAAAQTRNSPADAAQTRKGQLSVTGAPGTGSNPASRQPPETARAAIDNAFAVMGIG